jgi:hypothetical protein
VLTADIWLRIRTVIADAVTAAATAGGRIRTVSDAELEPDPAPVGRNISRAVMADDPAVAAVTNDRIRT